MEDIYPLQSSRPRYFPSLSDAEDETELSNGLRREQLKALEDNSDASSSGNRQHHEGWIHEDVMIQSSDSQPNDGPYKALRNAHSRRRTTKERYASHKDATQHLRPPDESSLPRKSEATGPSSWALAKRRSPANNSAAYERVKKAPDPQHVIDGLPEIERLRRQVAEMEIQLEKAKATPGTSTPPAASLGYRHMTLHVIGYSDKRYYLDEPQWTILDDLAPILQAYQGIRNPDQYLDNHPEIAFVFYSQYDHHPPADISKLMDRDGVLRGAKPETETLELVSKQMMEAMGSFVALVPNFDIMFPRYEPSDGMSAPYQIIYYCDSYLDDVCLNLEPLHASLVRQLFDAVRNRFGRQFALADLKAKKGLVTKQLLPFLIRPGDILVKEDGPRTQGYTARSWLFRPKSYYRDSFADPQGDVKQSPKLRKHEPESSKRESVLSFSVSVTSFTFDGTFHLRKEELTVDIVSAYDDDEVKICDLNLYPLVHGSKNIEEDLLRRGEMLWRCRNQRLVNYRAETDSHLENASDRFMVDMVTCRKLMPEWFDEPLSEGYYSYSDMADDKPPPAPSIFTFPPTVFGYNLRIKKWRRLFVDDIVDVTWNKQAFEHLVADDKIKTLIKALVTNQLAENQTTDVIDAKGGGLVILLHGGPGTGKTFTAEGVAEFAEKPLLRVTCGDAGVEAREVERYLQNVFRLGHLWDCVVLLDEADVFLEERDIRDLNRNALVSVFLRILEYYQGILILTSNRVGTFDEAFKSRIQLALHYENLTKPQRQRIWRNFMTRVKSFDESDIDFNDIMDNLEELAKPELNGREIRNAVTTSRQLAKYEGRKLCYAHVKDALDVSSKFGTYLKSLFAQTDDERQRTNQIR